MWLFSKDNSNSFSYTKSGNGYNIENGWMLFNCTNNKGDEYSLFVNNDLSGNRQISVQNALKRMKTLKHPDIINYVDSNESPKEISIVTEKVLPLEIYLKEKVDSVGGNFNFITSWGLIQVLRVLSFFEEKCKLQHNYICLKSIFVTRSGDWCVGLLDYMTEAGATVSEKGIRLPDTLTQPPDGLKVDNYGFGCLIWEVFNQRLHIREDIRTSGNVPSKLTKIMQKMVHQRPNFRMNLSVVQKQLLSDAGFSDNFYVKTLLFLEEIQVQDQQDRISMLKDLINHVDSLPTDVINYKLIPAILILIGSPISSNQNSTQSQMNTEQVCTVIDVLVKVTNKSQNYRNTDSSSHNDDAYNEVCESILRVYTNCAARQTRVALLSRLDDVISVLSNQSNKKSKKMIDSDLFPAVITGLVDTNPVVRETTLKACLGLAKHISISNLTDILIKNVCGLMVKDEQGGIRTNSAVLLAKITPILLQHESLSASNKKAALSVMVSSLLRVTRDSFQPARMACVCALDSLALHIDPNDLACKLLPCLAFLTLDPDMQVRQQTISSMRTVLDILQKNSEKMSSGTPNSTESTETNQKSSSASTASKWSDWVGLGNISSKFMSSGSSAAPTVLPANNSVSSASSQQPSNQKVVTQNKPDSPAAPTKSSPKVKVKGAMNLSTTKHTEETETNDWLNSFEDDDDDDDDFFMRDIRQPMKSQIASTKPVSNKKFTPPTKSKLTAYKNQEMIKQSYADEDDEEDGWGNTDW